MLRKTISVVVLISLASPAFSYWTWISDDRLVKQGGSQYVDRFEIMRADDGNGLQLCAWAKIGDKACNALKRWDVAKLDPRLDNVQVLDQIRGLRVADDFDVI